MIFSNNKERLILMQDYNSKNPNNPHNAVEIPLPKERTSVFGILLLVCVLIGIVIFMMAAVKNQDILQKYGQNVLIGIAALMLYGPVMAIIHPFVETNRLRRVCTQHVGGTLVGHASKYVRDYDSENNRDNSYYKYAPKYEIYINGRFEIRTLNDFTRSRKDPRTLALLANPNGYEIMPATRKMSYSARQSVKAGIIMLIIYAIVAAFIFLFVFNRFL